MAVALMPFYKTGEIINNRLLWAVDEPKKKNNKPKQKAK
jgi:hypothetical protein